MAHGAPAWWEHSPHRGDLVNAVPQLRLVGLAPGERGEAGQQLKDLAAGWGRRPRRFQLGVPSQLGCGRGGDEAVQGPGGQPAARVQEDTGVRDALAGAGDWGVRGGQSRHGHGAWALGAAAHSA